MANRSERGVYTIVKSLVMILEKEPTVRYVMIDPTFDLVFPHLIMMA